MSKRLQEKRKADHISDVNKFSKRNGSLIPSSQEVINVSCSFLGELY
jgi:hypothetical protein